MKAAICSCPQKNNPQSVIFKQKVTSGLNSQYRAPYKKTLSTALCSPAQAANIFLEFKMERVVPLFVILNINSVKKRERWCCGESGVFSVSRYYMHYTENYSPDLYVCFWFKLNSQKYLRKCEVSIYPFDVQKLSRFSLHSQLGFMLYFGFTSARLIMNRHFLEKKKSSADIREV